jgi:hypothetical protein
VPWFALGRRWYVEYNQVVKRAFATREEAEASARRAADRVGRVVRIRVTIEVSRKSHLVE